jgi:SAM-dependent methyltransferase
MEIKQRVLGRIMQWWAHHGGLAQFHQPTGAVGHVAGWIMGRCSSNVARNRWAVQLLDVQPTDRVIELGCGPGVAIATLASRAIRGLVVGVDHSQVMIRQARRRNRAAIRAGRVRLIHTPVESLSISDGPFNAALAVNTVGLWPDPTARLRELARLLRPGGRIAWYPSPAVPVPPRPLRRRPPASSQVCLPKLGSSTSEPKCSTSTRRRRSCSGTWHLPMMPSSSPVQQRSHDTGCTGRRPVQGSAPATARQIPEDRPSSR